MAYTIYQYTTMSQGGPIEPPFKRTASQAVGSAVLLEPEARFVVLVPDATTNIRFSYDGSAATAADHKLSAGTSYGFAVQPHTTTYVYGL